MGAALAQVGYSYEVSGGISGVWIALYVIFIVAIYLFMGFCLMKMANKTGTPNGWFGFIPILNFWLMVQIAQRDVLWFILLLIPCVNIVIFIIVWMDIAAVMGFENWWGILMIIPIFNFYVMYKLAFTEPY